MNTIFKLTVAAAAILAAGAALAQSATAASGTTTGPGAGYADTTPNSRNDANAESSKASAAPHHARKHKAKSSAKPATTNPKETGGTNGPTPAN